MRNRPADLVRRWIHRWRAWQPSETRIAYRVLDAGRRAGVMVDVGAHHGGSLAPFAAAGWRVHAFEPDPDNRRVLTRRFARHAAVTVDPRAVSDAVRPDAAFYTSPASSGIGTLAPFDPGHRRTARVATTTLGAYLERHGVDRVDLLKVDAEGHDLRVLRGVPFERVRPSLVVCEFDDRKGAGRYEGYDGLRRLLRARGYHVLVSEWHPVRRYGERHRWRRFVDPDRGRPAAGSWGNLIAGAEARLFGRCRRHCRRAERLARLHGRIVRPKD